MGAISSTPRRDNLGPLIFALLALTSCVLPSGLLAQKSQKTVVYVEAQYDSIPSHRYAAKFDSMLRASRFDSLLQNALIVSLNDLRRQYELGDSIRFIGMDFAGDRAPGAAQRDTLVGYILRLSAFIDKSRSLNFVVNATFSASKQIVMHIPRRIPLVASELDSILNSSGEENPGLVVARRSLAAYLKRDVKRMFLRWLVEVSDRIFVSVQDHFHPEAVSWGLQHGITEMLKSELAKASSIVIFEETAARSPVRGVTARDTLAPAAQLLATKDLSGHFSEPEAAERVPNPRLDYRVENMVLQIGDQLLVFAAIINERTHRMLTSFRAVVPELDAMHVSATIGELGKKAAHAIVADSKEIKTLAVIMSPPEKLFLRMSKDDSTIAFQILRTLAQKLRLLAQTPVDPQTQKTVLGAQIQQNPEIVRKYMRRFVPAEAIAADLGLNYLILLGYEDLGDRLRLPVYFYRFDPERPIYSHLIPDREIKKTEINQELNRILRELLTEFCKMGLLDFGPDRQAAGRACDTIDVDLLFAGSTRLKKQWRRVINRTIPEIRPNRGLGFRIGGVTNRSSEALFLGKGSATYFEFFYVYYVFNAKGLDFGLEPSFGLDRGRFTGLFRGIIAYNSFLNAKVRWAGFQYSRFPIIMSMGGGLGFQGIKYSFKTGDPNYLGKSDFKNNAIEAPAFNLFGEIVLPITEKLRFDILFRHVFPSATIDKFRGVQHEFAQGIDPVGELGGAYVMGGVKYAFR